MVEQSSFTSFVGKTVGRYRLKQLLERDRFGPVFLAEAERGGGQFRLRLLLVGRNLTAEERVIYLGNVQQEANRVANLRHEAILPLEDYGTYEGMPYLVWPHHPIARSLHASIVQSGPLDLLTSSRYLDQISAALEYAHRHAILHCNLTSYGTMLYPAATPQQARLAIAEFGLLHMLELAWQDNPAAMPPLNASSEGCAPEQVSRKAADVATDTYALGAVLYRMLTGRRVFTGKSQEEIIQNVLHAKVLPLAMWRADLPLSLDAFMARALAKDSAQRFRSPMELANVFHALAVPQDKARPALVVEAPVSVAGRQVAPVAALALPVRSTGRAAEAVSRRRVLYYVGAGGVVVVAMAFVGTRLLGGSAGNMAVKGTGGVAGGSNTGSSNTNTGSAIIARTDEIRANSAKTFHIANQGNPGILIHLANSNTFVAFDSTCTHEGCAVGYNGQTKLLECPCHGATFDPAKNAAVVQGPATTPLKPIPITVNADGTITER